MKNDTTLCSRNLYRDIAVHSVEQFGILLMKNDISVVDKVHVEIVQLVTTRPGLACNVRFIIPERVPPVVKLPEVELLLQGAKKLVHLDKVLFLGGHVNLGHAEQLP